MLNPLLLRRFAGCNSLPLLMPTLMLMLAAPAGCGRGDSPHSAPAPPQPIRLAATATPNPVRLHERVISGGLPEGPEAFAELERWGVRTIISVDGAKPDVELAARYGIRYVHLPHGYDGVPEERIKQLAKAVRDLPGPIYVHCHHGKHRSPAAASAACIAAGLLPPERGLEVLQLAGTDTRYVGLFQAVKSARPLSPEVLDRVPADFPEVAELPPLAEAMVALEQILDRLRDIEQAGWRAPASHPDLAAGHQALLLRECYAELLRATYLNDQPPAFLQKIAEEERAALALEAALDLEAGAALEAAEQALASRSLHRIVEGCRDCHHAFRDTPRPR